MAPLHRLLVGLSLVLVLTGAAGVLVHRNGSDGRQASGGVATGPPSTGAGADTTTTTAETVATPSTAAGRPGADDAALRSGLITPTDMGGYYRTVPSTGAALVASAPCLAPLRSGATQSGRAVTALLGPDEHSVPTVIEEVASYPATSARGRYESAVAAIGSCPVLSFDFGGAQASGRLTPGSIPAVGDADRVWSGSFAMGPADFTIQIGVVLAGQEVLALIWIDSAPPADPVMGSFTSTVSLAIGKLA